MSKIKVDEISPQSSNTSSITLAANNDVTFTGGVTANTFAGSGSSLTSLPAANLTGTLPALSAANLTSIPAANLTGTLPAIDGSNLTGIGGTTHPAWYGGQDTEQNVDTNTWTTLVNLADNTGVGTVVNPSSNNGGWDESTGIFTVQSGQAGSYYAFMGVGIDDIQGDDIVWARISKNNDTSTNSIGYTKHEGTGANQIIQAQVSTLFTLAVGDTLRAMVYHTEGSTEPTETRYCYFGGFRIFAT